MKIPGVTVGMPAYNRAHVLRDTIQQVLDQTFTDFEFIIYNDGSSDNTAEIVNSFNDHRIIFIDRNNLGPPHPLNAILEKATGEFIIILHDHDFFHQQLIEKSVAALKKYPAAGFILQGSSWIDEDGISDYREMLLDLPEFNKGRPFGEAILLDKKKFSSVFHACSMVRRSAYEAVGKSYNVAFGLYADIDLWLRLLNEYDFVYLKEVLFKFRTREASGHFLTGRDFDILNWIYSIHQHNCNCILVIQICIANTFL
jgi:glycosyltransferase involved in cell wall biosynthesis